MLYKLLFSPLTRSYFSFPIFPTHLPARPTPAIMSDPVEIRAHNGDHFNEKGISQVEDSHNLDENAKLAEYKAAAMEAETAEQQSGVLQAVREYPMAALWAFIMSCTIVSRFSSVLQQNRS